MGEIKPNHLNKCWRTFLQPQILVDVSYDMLKLYVSFFVCFIQFYVKLNIKLTGSILPNLTESILPKLTESTLCEHLVRFRHINQLVRVRKRSWLGLLPQTRLEKSWSLFNKYPLQSLKNIQLSVVFNWSAAWHPLWLAFMFTKETRAKHVEVISYCFSGAL